MCGTARLPTPPWPKRTGCSSSRVLRAPRLAVQSHFGKSENFPRVDSAIVPRWAINSNYEKINLHFRQCRASRSVRTKDRSCRSGEFACAREENRAKYHRGESASHHGKDKGNDKHHDNSDVAGADDFHQHDDDHHDFEPQPVGLALKQLRKASRESFAGSLSFCLFARALDPDPSGKIRSTIRIMSRKQLSFPKTRRLTLSSEFARVKGQGTAERGRFLVLGALKVKEETSFRAGFVTPKHIGGAVVRNRVRRRLRNIVRTTQPQLRAGLWLVVVARPHAAKATHEQLRDEWLRLAERASILAP